MKKKPHVPPQQAGAAEELGVHLLDVLLQVPQRDELRPAVFGDLCELLAVLAVGAVRRRVRFIIALVLVVAQIAFIRKQVVHQRADELRVLRIISRSPVGVELQVEVLLEEVLLSLSGPLLLLLRQTSSRFAAAHFIF